MSEFKRLPWWRRLSISGRRWSPGPIYTEYRKFGGCGRWEVDEAGADLWVTPTIDADREFWSLSFFAHPTRWVEV
ncbi:hypothetical protein K8O93_00755 [Gordonia bronchialis]|uniref:hypothetical protein n=1 Tax=Gordonia bronchialis TaxID=2054 RepID=UPI001CBCBE8F|nr:hypothetical protein [Gordonia bronchialis]UAK38363.1 hypothetical protein K8O93_00755 [Gordonia bronchialis]